MYTYYDTADHEMGCGGCGGDIVEGDTYLYSDGFLTCEGCLIADKDDGYYDYVRRPMSHEGRQHCLDRRQSAWEKRQAGRAIV